MSGHDGIIDVWNVETFDDELRGDLDVHGDVIRDYMLTSRREWLEREASDRTMPYPENPYAGEFIWVKEHIMRLMEARTIRAWHYTRMTDEEIGALRQGGEVCLGIAHAAGGFLRSGGGAAAAGTAGSNAAVPVADHLFDLGGVHDSSLISIFREICLTRSVLSNIYSMIVET